jgi:hypothetical protein
MTIQDIIESDKSAIFGVEANTPISVQAVYTPKGGSAEDAVTVFYFNEPLHGDAYGNYKVEDEDIKIVGQTSDISGWQIDGTVTINSIDYEIAMAPYPTDGYWAVVALRRPLNNQTRI